VVVPDFPHHVAQRAARRMDVFFSADDRQEYLGLLPRSASKRSADCFTGCLMSNHAFAAQEGWLAEGQEKEMKYTVPGNSSLSEGSLMFSDRGETKL
jgi:hypothetical protein